MTYKIELKVNTEKFEEAPMAKYFGSNGTVTWAGITESNNSFKKLTVTAVEMAGDWATLPAAKHEDWYLNWASIPVAQKPDLPVTNEDKLSFVGFWKPETDPEYTAFLLQRHRDYLRRHYY